MSRFVPSWYKLAHLFGGTRMADYDASVRVNTKVDNSDLRETQKEFDKLTKKLETLRARAVKMEVLGGTEKQFESLGYDTELVEDKLAEVTNRMEALKAVSGIEDGFEETKEAGNRFFKTIQDGTKKSDSLFSTMGSRLKGIALSLLVFNWITKGFNAMVSAMKEGFHNLAQYSKDYNQSMSELKSQTEQLKNGLAAAAEPIANILIPYLTRLVEWLNVAVDTVGQFLAVMQGKSTYTRAKKQVLDYAKSLDTASKSAKRALSSFDELNVLSKEESAGASGALTGADAFEEAAINPEIYMMLEKVKKLLEVIKPLAIVIGVAFLAWKLGNILKDLGTVSANLWNAYAIILIIAGTALAVYHYLDMWKNGVDWEGIKGYIAGVMLAVLGVYMLFGPFAAGIALIVFGIAGLVLAFKDMTENGITAENMTLAVISAVLVLAGVFLAFGVTAGVVVAAVMVVLGIFAAMIIWAGNGEEALENLKSQFKYLGTFVKSVFAGDWETAFEAIVGISRNSLNMATILVESFVNGIIKAVNKVIDILGELTSSFPDWIPSIGWKLELPRLADGAVIQGGKPFAAILGDQPAGQTNVETPLSTIEQALQNVYDKNGSTGEIQLTVNLDGEPIYKNMVKRDKIYRKANGNSAFAF